MSKYIKRIKMAQTLEHTHTYISFSHIHKLILLTILVYASNVYYVIVTISPSTRSSVAQLSLVLSWLLLLRSSPSSQTVQNHQLSIAWQISSWINENHMHCGTSNMHRTTTHIYIYCTLHTKTISLRKI